MDYFESTGKPYFRSTYYLHYFLGWIRKETTALQRRFRYRSYNGCKNQANRTFEMSEEDLHHSLLGPKYMYGNLKDEKII